VAVTILIGPQKIASGLGNEIGKGELTRVIPAEFWKGRLRHGRGMLREWRSFLKMTTMSSGWVLVGCAGMDWLYGLDATDSTPDENKLLYRKAGKFSDDG